MNFEAYLASKNIDSIAFKAAEPELWNSWNEEFSQVHPNSFTAQKLYLINPVRRMYQLPFVEKAPVTKPPVIEETAKVSTSLKAAPKIPGAAPKIPGMMPKIAAPKISPPTEIPNTESTSETPTSSQIEPTQETVTPKPVKPAMPRPVFKPKPKPE